MDALTRTRVQAHDAREADELDALESYARPDLVRESDIRRHCSAKKSAAVYAARQSLNLRAIRKANEIRRAGKVRVSLAKVTLQDGGA